MKIREILDEAFTLDSTINSVISDIGAPVTQSYDELKKSAMNFFNNNGTLDGFGLISGSVDRRNWWDKIWAPPALVGKGSRNPQPGLQGHLYDLVKQSGGKGAELAKLLSDMSVKRPSFNRLGRSLPDILQRLGMQLGSKNLASRAAKWKQESDDYNAWLADLVSAPPKIAKPTKNSPTKPDEPIAKVLPSVIPGQNAAVEKVVNDVLKHLPSGVAGDIRLAISKSSNKLQALQAELAKRNITT